MKTVGVLLILVAALGLTGCIPSLYPLFNKDDLVSYDGLLGTWREGDADEGSTWSFSRVDSLEYRLELTEDNKTGQYETHALKLGAYYFLDIRPILSDSLTDLYGGLLISAHLFGRLDLHGDTMVVSWLSDKWLEKKIDEKAVSISHEEMNGDLLLTARTKELQQLVLAHINDEEAFSPDSLTRVR